MLEKHNFASYTRARLLLPRHLHNGGFWVCRENHYIRHVTKYSHVIHQKKRIFMMNKKLNYTMYSKYIGGILEL